MRLVKHQIAAVLFITGTKEMVKTDLEDFSGRCITRNVPTQIPSKPDWRALPWPVHSSE